MTEVAPSFATRECLSAPPRELAQRLSGATEVLLLWHPDIDGLELSVCDPATGAGFHVEVTPVDEIEALYHPHAYAARRESAYRVHRDGAWILDG